MQFWPVGGTTSAALIGFWSSALNNQALNSIGNTVWLGLILF